jgi:hypothetical protein
MAITIDRTGITLTNDTGTPAAPVGDGTLLNAADRVALLDKIDALFNGTRSATFTLGTLLAVDGFGVHNFSAGGTGANVVAVRNTTAGTGNYSELRAGNDSSASLGRFIVTASTYTSVGATYQSGVTIDSAGAGGLNLAASHASGPFRLFTGNTQRLAIDSVGVLTPLNSLKMAYGFLAYNSADDTSVSSGSTVDFDTEVYDEGGNFSGDTFTAPFTGRYLLSACVFVSNVSGGTLNSGARIVVSNHTGGFFIGYAAIANSTQHAFSGAVVVDMDSGDTATVQYYSDTGSATVRGDNAGLRLTWFSGRCVL